MIHWLVVSNHPHEKDAQVNQPFGRANSKCLQLPSSYWMIWGYPYRNQRVCRFNNRDPGDGYHGLQLWPTSVDSSIPSGRLTMLCITVMSSWYVCLHLVDYCFSLLDINRCGWFLFVIIVDGYLFNWQFIARHVFTSDDDLCLLLAWNRFWFLVSCLSFLPLLYCWSWTHGQVVTQSCRNRTS